MKKKKYAFVKEQKKFLKSQNAVWYNKLYLAHSDDFNKNQNTKNQVKHTENTASDKCTLKSASDITQVFFLRRNIITVSRKVSLDVLRPIVGSQPYKLYKEGMLYLRKWDLGVSRVRSEGELWPDSSRGFKYFYYIYNIIY